MGANFVLVPGILVDMRGSQDSEPSSWSAGWDPDLSARATGRFYTLVEASINGDQKPETNTNTLVLHNTTPQKTATPRGVPEKEGES